MNHHSLDRRTRQEPKNQLRRGNGDAKVVREPGPMAHGGTHIAFIEDPNGYRIELIDLTRRSQTAS